MDEDEYAATAWRTRRRSIDSSSSSRPSVSSRWIDLAESKLDGTGIRCYATGGNDDVPEVMAVMDRTDTEHFVGCESRAVQLDDRHIMVSMPYVNPTPWHTPREAPEPELAERIERIAGDLPEYGHAIFNFHAPPIDSTLDTCPKLDWTTDPPSQIVVGGQPVLYGAGSRGRPRRHRALSADARPPRPHPRVAGGGEARADAVRQPWQRVRRGRPARLPHHDRRRPGQGLPDDRRLTGGGGRWGARRCASEDRNGSRDEPYPVLEVTWMATAVATPEVFVRKSSGLVRVMSPSSAFVYNVLTMGLIFPWTYLWAPGALPGGQLVWGILLAMLLEIPIALSYVWLSTAFPRTGGDYVFQSRVFGGGIAFPIVFSGFVIWILQWVALSGWLLATLGFAPLFLGLAAATGNSSLVDISTWFTTAEGIVITSIVNALLALLILVSGFRNYIRLQRVMWIAILLSFGTMLLVLVDHARAADVPGKLDAFSAAIGGSATFTADATAAASAAGVDSTPPSACSRPCSSRRSRGRRCNGRPTAASRTARSRAPARSATRPSSSSAR